MVRKPNILILDEATSALDPVNEKIVQTALDELVRTTGASTLTIAHRLTTVMKCDKILVFAEGRLKEQGTHEELLEIQVERLPPRGKDKEGQITSGLYKVQWHNMMGTKLEESQEEKPMPAEPTSPTKDELAKLRAENLVLRSQLHVVQKKLQVFLNQGRVTTIHEGTPRVQSDQLQTGNRGLFDWPSTKCDIRGLNLEYTTQMLDPCVVEGVIKAPPMLSLGNRVTTTPW